ncbi:hypothetical protein GCM10009610_58750 [Pseudonocardia xinjiangensis]
MPSCREATGTSGLVTVDADESEATRTGRTLGVVDADVDGCYFPSGTWFLTSS